MSSHLAFKLDLTSCVSPGAVRTAVQGSSRAFADLVLVGCSARVDDDFDLDISAGKAGSTR